MSVPAITAALWSYVFRPADERQLQDQVVHALALNGITASREVRTLQGRYDLLVGRVVLELKLAAPAAAVERQAQRYAADPDVDAVVVATTSARLARQLRATDLGGKPFAVIALRGF